MAATPMMESDPKLEGDATIDGMVCDGAADAAELRRDRLFQSRYRPAQWNRINPEFIDRLPDAEKTEILKQTTYGEFSALHRRMAHAREIGGKELDRAQAIIDEVCARMQVERDQILGKLRGCAHVSGARQFAMWLIRRETGLSFPKIGKIFRRDHATAIHAFRVMEAAHAIQAAALSKNAATGAGGGKNGDS